MRAARLLETVVLGGADGPTSVFVVGKISGMGLFWLVLGIVIAIAAVIIVWKRYKKKKES